MPWRKRTREQRRAWWNSLSEDERAAWLAKRMGDTSREHAPEPKSLGPYAQATSIDAFLRRAGGKTPRLTLVEPDNNSVSAECTEETLKQLRHHLHEWLRFHGEGKWFRSPRGTWRLRGFTVSGFERIEGESLTSAIDRMRAIRGTDWERMDDPFGFIREIRRDDDEAV